VHYLWLLFLRGKAWFTWTICECLLCREYVIASSIGLIPNGIVWSCLSSCLMLQAIESWDFQGYGIMLGCLGLFGLFTILERRIGQLNALIIHECLSMFLMTFTHSLLCGRWIGRYFFHIKTQHLSFLACLFNPKTQYLFCLLSCFVYLFISIVSNKIYRSS